VFAAEIHDVQTIKKIAWELELADEREFFFELSFYRVLIAAYAVARQTM